MGSTFVLLSATWPDGVRRLSKSYLKDPMIVYIGTLDLAVSGFVFFGLYYFYQCAFRNKTSYVRTFKYKCPFHIHRSNSHGFT